MQPHIRLAALRGATLLASLVLVASGCSHAGVAAPAEEPAPSRAAQVEPYTPGLGEIMSLTQMRHLKLWLAGRARNWELAAYEIDELEEGFADAVRFHPEHKDAPRPLTELIPEYTTGPIRALREAAERSDPSAFSAAYDSLTEGCNGCHVASGFSFNAVVRPSANPYSNQRFELSR